MPSKKPIHLDVDDRLRALEGIELLARCSPPERRQIAEHAHLVSFDDGDVIFRQGEVGLGFYIVLAGAARVVRDGKQINTIERGGWFGEVALLEGVPRTPT